MNKLIILFILSFCITSVVNSVEPTYDGMIRQFTIKTDTVYIWINYGKIRTETIAVVEIKVGEIFDKCKIPKDAIGFMLSKDRKSVRVKVSSDDVLKAGDIVVLCDPNLPE